MQAVMGSECQGLLEDREEEEEEDKEENAAKHPVHLSYKHETR